MPNLPPYIAPAKFDDAEAALAQVRAIHTGSTEHLRSALQRFVAGADDGQHVRACYPFVRVRTDTVARADSRLSYGFVAGPGTGGGRKGNKTAEAKQEGALPRVEKPRAGKGKDIVSAGPEETSSSQGLPSREVPVDETTEVATETVKTPRRKRRAPGRSTQRRRKTANQSVPPDGDGEAPPETLP